jgi:hypothetical protein
LNLDYAEEDEEDELKVFYFIFFIFFSVIQVQKKEFLSLKAMGFRSGAFPKSWTFKR